MRAGQSAWLISRHEHAVAALKDPPLVKDKSGALTAEQTRRQPWMPALFQPLIQNMLDSDPPAHTRLRALVHKAFTPSLVEQLRDRVDGFSNQLIQEMLRNEAVDLIHSYGLPIPTTVIAEILGVPAADKHLFHSLVKANR